MSEVRERLKVAATAFVIISAVVVCLLGLVLEVKHSIRMKVYAVSHDCSWVYYGDVPGNDEGYICK